MCGSVTGLFLHRSVHVGQYIHVKSWPRIEKSRTLHNAAIGRQRNQWSCPWWPDTKHFLRNYDHNMLPVRRATIEAETKWPPFYRRHFVFWLNFSEMCSYGPGVGVTKAPFVNFSVSKIFDLAKVHVRFLESHSYLTGVPAAELRWHLSNINAIFNS